MPFGLCNVVPAFERLMETVLIDLKWRICLVYLDYCATFSKVFRLTYQVTFLGHIVTPPGILSNPEKVKAMTNVHPRATYMRFNHSWVSLVTFGERLKVKDTPFVWNDDCESAFLQLK
ncbi:Retrovirus-related Pol Polyprotein from transposon 412 [Phytophthora megakarya]|uniref:Retrovirus-related Pol Polyprotein from transposon 412 n=1 Tax=Phytophthora megakarya TaxID=4795 RepID=A0A225W312_9STRA|nr:Retrovirus-related Pol Polyprotein from transposon 412 [Phytophthora megakarya]